MNENAKYMFLKQYDENTKTTEDNDIDDAITGLNAFFENLPERAKGPERTAEFDYVTQKIVEAFSSIVKKIANCPYVKIEISNQIEFSKAYKKIDNIHTCQIYTQGFLDSMNLALSKLEKAMVNKNELQRAMDEMSRFIQSSEDGASRLKRKYYDMYDLLEERDVEDGDESSKSC